jgi:hypothetical protein
MPVEQFVFLARVSPRMDPSLCTARILAVTYPPDDPNALPGSFRPLRPCQLPAVTVWGQYPVCALHQEAAELDQVLTTELLEAFLREAG